MKFIDTTLLARKQYEIDLASSIEPLKAVS